ncbi:MAG TPA: peptidoglycan bridge formation glycyltransferase FemA/FemB family protein [Chloroflexota bacterium]
MRYFMSVTVQRWDDAPSWNQFVASTPGAHFQQSWEWGELAPLLGGRVTRLAACSGDTVVGGMQVFVNPIRGTGRTMLYVPRGPAVEEPCLDVLGPLTDAARQIGLEERSIGIRLEPNAPEDDQPWTSAVRALGLHPTWPPSQPRSAWVLDIDCDEDVLLAGMKQKTRYNIRLAGKRAVSVAEGLEADLDAFYALYEETSARDDFFIQSKEFYRQTFEAFRSAGNFCMLIARHEGKAIAAVTLIRFGATCWYVHGASSNEHRNLMATYLLQWESIRQARRWGCRLYDFRAIPDILREDQDMYGVYRFKEGFGGRKVTTMHTHSAAYQPGIFGLWQAYFSGRFAVQEWQRRRHKLPARQFA